MIGSCPSDNSEKRLETLCTATSSSFEMPVFDLDDKSAYKNISVPNAITLLSQFTGNFPLLAKGASCLVIFQDVER